MDKIQFINSKKAEEIIQNRVPKGLFIVRDGNLFVGIDNYTGDAWTEEFNQCFECILWLLRYNN